MKDVKRRQDKKAKKEGKAEEKEAKGSKNEMKSSKFFKRMEEVTKQDAAKKEGKKQAKLDQTNSTYVNHSNQPTKRFKFWASYYWWVKSCLN